MKNYQTIILFHYKSISIKQNKNYGKHKSQIRDFGLALSLRLIFINQTLSKAVQNWPISLASFILLWEIHLRQEAFHSNGPRVLFKCSLLVSLPQGYLTHCCLDALGLKRAVRISPWPTIIQHVRLHTKWRQKDLLLINIKFPNGFGNYIHHIVVKITQNMFLF